MAVHGRYGQPCPVCGSPVQRIVYSENECNYCARCQTGAVILADRALSRLCATAFRARSTKHDGRRNPNSGTAAGRDCRVGVAAKRLQVPPSILLVVTGVALALVPGLPTVQLAPELVLLLVLPPIVYSSAVAMSWRESASICAPSRCSRSGASPSRPSRWPRRCTGSWACPGRWLRSGCDRFASDAVAPLSIARRLQLPREFWWSSKGRAWQ